MKRCICSVLAVITLALGFTACAPKQDGAALVPNSQRSPAFESVARELDLGGELFVFIDTEGDAAAAASMGQDIWEMIAQMLQEEGEFVPPVNIEKIWASFGLNNIEAIGMSSVRNPAGGFTNRSFLYIPEEREGFMLLSGGDPRPFMAYDFAPAGVDVVSEGDVYLKTLVEVIRQVAETIAGPMVDVYLEQGLQKPINGEDGLTWGELVDQLDTRVLFTVDMEEGQAMDIEHDGLKLTFPKTQALVVLENVGVFYPQIISALPPELKELTQEQQVGGLEAVVITPPALPEATTALAYLKPTIARDADGRLFLASSPEYLEASLEAKGALRQNKAFIGATDEFPEKGNALSYVSPQLFPALHALLDQFDSLMEQEMEARPYVYSPDDKRAMALALKFYRMMIPQVDYPMAEVLINRPDGIYAISNICYSHKMTLAAIWSYPIAVGVYSGILANMFHGMSALD